MSNSYYNISKIFPFACVKKFEYTNKYSSEERDEQQNDERYVSALDVTLREQQIFIPYTKKGNCTARYLSNSICFAFVSRNAHHFRVALLSHPSACRKRERASLRQDSLHVTGLLYSHSAHRTEVFSMKKETTSESRASFITLLPTPPSSPHGEGLFPLRINFLLLLTLYQLSTAQ